MVQADYDAALSECTRLVPLAHPLHAQGCTAYVQASTGQLAPAYEALNKVARRGRRGTRPSSLLWVRTRLAEMAARLQRWPEAEAHFKEALQLGVTDQFLLGAYADFLLQQKRPAEVLTLLAGWERSDILLLRLAMAGRALNDTRAGGWAAQLRDRFAAAAQRGDRLHEQEAARFELDIEGNAGQGARSGHTQLQGPEGAARRRNPDACRAWRPSKPRPRSRRLDWLRTNSTKTRLSRPWPNSWPRRGPSDDALVCHPRRAVAAHRGLGPQAQRQLPDPARFRRQRPTSPCAGTSPCATSTTCCNSTATATAN